MTALAYIRSEALYWYFIAHIERPESLCQFPRSEA